MIPITILVLGVIGIVAAVLLFLAAKKFHVYENPVIGQVEELLPGANCGGCGFSGCHAFAVECANATSLEGLYCTSLPKGGMLKVAEIVGLAPSEAQKKVAVVKCGANCETRRQVNIYDGVSSCAIEASLYQGESNCVYGCLGNGDCVKACPFDAMQIDPVNRLAHVDFDKCTGCGKCVEACPRNLCELVAWPKDRALVWVVCSNKDKGAVVTKECGLGCIGCSKCRKVCPTQSPAITSFLAYIDQNTCISCGNCIEACPRHCIFSSSPIEKKEEESVTETTSEKL
ncbi:MAG: RnfABCDGE type electron transport complex subunit B [Muribaculaceae bacterium]|nr:RnfABCDGE type electron transport complex subunit B [Muribaculaceae bacterium]